MATLAKVQNIDEVLRAHKQFLESCMKDCHLSTKHIFKIIHKLLVIVTQFVNFVNQIHRQIEGKADLRLAGEGRLEHLERTFGSHFHEQIDKHDENFSSYMLKLIDGLKTLSTKETSDSVLNLVIKLDFNHYYAKMTK
jgi:gamma-tubulin complex component 2